MDQSYFSENRKISTRQVQRSITLEMLGVSSLILPRILAAACGTDGVFAMVLGAAGAAGMLRLWGSFARKRDFYQALKDCGKPVRLLWSAVYGAAFLALSGYALFLLTKVMEEQLLNVKFEPVILLTLTAAGVFGVLKGLESRVRIYEVLYWLLILPLALILCLAAASVNPEYWTPVFAAAPAGFARGVYLSFVFFSFVSMFLVFQPHCSRPERAEGGVRRGLVTVLLLNVAIYLILVGIFQPKLLANLPYPVITLMAVVKLPGEFFERQDAFMAAIWFFCLFSLLNAMLFYGKEMLQNGVRAFLPQKDGEKGRQTGKKNNWWALGCGAGILIFALILLRADAAAAGFWQIFVYGLFPLMTVMPLPVFLLGRTRRAGKKAA